MVIRSVYRLRCGGARMFSWCFRLRWKQGSYDVAKPNSADLLDDLYSRLLDRKGKGPGSVAIEEEELILLNMKARQALRHDPMLLELNPPIKIVGNFQDLLRWLDLCGNPATTSYLCLGNYVNRGQLSLETISLVLCLKVKYPQRFYLLRGKYETVATTLIFGFYDELLERFGPKRGEEVWKDFCFTFNYLPVAAVVGNRILCMNGGLSPDLEDLNQIRRLPRPYETPDYGLLCDLVWSNPSDDETVTWAEGLRGVSFCYGPKAVETACDRFGIDLIIRGNQVE